MNAEEREYKERRSLSKLSPWYSEDMEEKTAPKTFSLPIEENEEND